MLAKFAKFYTLGLKDKKPTTVSAFDQYKVVLQAELHLVSQKCVTTIGLLNNRPQACKTLQKVQEEAKSMQTTVFYQH